MWGVLGLQWLVSIKRCFGQCSAGKPVIHVDVTLTRTTFLSRRPCAPFMETAFLDGYGLFQQDDAPCHKAGIWEAQQWVWRVDLASKLPRYQSNCVSQCGCVGHSHTNNTPVVILRSVRAGCSIFFTPNSGGSLIKSSCAFVINCCGWLISLSSV